MKFFSDPSRDIIYHLVDEYYDSPFLVKIKELDNGYSMYAVELSCLLLNEKRYLIALCPTDIYAIGIQRPLKEIRWDSFQSRALSEEFEGTNKHTYNMKRADKFLLPLKIMERTTSYSKYRMTDNIDVILLHTKGLEYEYPNEGNLVSALETFQTVIQFQSI